MLHETSGEGTTGVDDQYAQAYFAEVGAEIMGAGMFGLHAAGDDPDRLGWRGRRAPVPLPGPAQRSCRRTPAGFAASRERHLVASQLPATLTDATGTISKPPGW